MHRILGFVFASSILLGVCRGQEADATSTETRLREALRSTMLQLNDAQNQVIAAQAAQAQSDKDNAALKAKVDAQAAQIATLAQQEADEKAASDQAIANLNAKVADDGSEIARLQESLDAWKAGYAEKVQLANAKEAARVQLAGQAILLQRLVDDREEKNLELYRTGSEILTRYEKFSLGDAIGAREPFVGISREKLQALVQDYKDKLLDGTVTPGQAPSSPNPAVNRVHQAAAPADKSLTRT